MDINVTFSVNKNIFLKDPEQSPIGKQLVIKAVDLLEVVGFESFTFKKLAAEVGTTEATIYRYFENKHRLLLYIINWYWSYMEYLIEINTQNINKPKEKLTLIIKLLAGINKTPINAIGYNIEALNKIVIAESSKVYLVKEVSEINKNEVYKPYKDLCKKVADIVVLLNPKYPYPKSLSSTIIETAHHQLFFCKHLPRLTDAPNKTQHTYVTSFIEDFVFRILL